MFRQCMMKYLVNKSLFLFRICLSGPQQSGKSTLLLQMLRFSDQIFSVKFETVYFSFSEDLLAESQPYMNSLRALIPNIRLIPGIPQLEELGLNQNPKSPKLLIIEDQVQCCQIWGIFPHPHPADGSNTEELR